MLKGVFCELGGSMYFPYLYGRQSELLAVSSMLKDHRSLDKLFPIIEPVLSKPSGVIKVLEAYQKKDQRIGLVVNPNKHQLGSVSGLKSWRDKVLPVALANDKVMPVVRCETSVTPALVKKIIAYFGNREIALAYVSAMIPDAAFVEFASLEKVRFHIVLDEDKEHRRYELLPQDKKVHIEDGFKRLARNADYGSADFFSRQHRTFKRKGLFGFGDYCSIGRGLAVGGGMAAAVAIHAAYLDERKDIYVEHFVSDDTDRSVGSLAEKFLQAADKLVDAAKARPKEFGSNFALDLFNDHVVFSHFPGLGKSKELQIAHHLCFTLDVLDGRL